MFKKSAPTVRFATSCAAVLVIALFCLAIPFHRAEAQPAVSPLFLFSTSDVVDDFAMLSEVRAQFNKIRNRRETAAVRAVGIANFASAVHAATIRIELEERTIIIDRDLQERIDEGKDSKHFWEGRSINGDELGLLFWRGRLSGRLRTQDKAYKIRPLKESLYALIEIAQLDPPPLGCDTPEGGKGEAAPKRGAFDARSIPQPFGTAKVSSVQQYTRVLALYTDNVMTEYASLEDLEWEIAWGIWDIKTAFQRTDAYTRPKHVGTEWISFDEPASWSSSSVIWEDKLLPFYDEIFDRREEYTADVVMLILKDGSTPPCCRGSSRTDDVTDIDDAIFYVDTPYIENTTAHTPAHEMGHMFGSPGGHSDGYFIKDASGEDVFSACFVNHLTLRRSTRTIMYEGLGGIYEGRALYYSSLGETMTHWCPDEGPYANHTFNLSDSPNRNTENSRIEANEDDVSNFWEDLGAPSMAAKAGTEDPAALDDADLPFTVENYPNPFNPQTTIRITLPEEAHVRLTVYDVLGREIMVLVDGTRLAGTHEAHFDGSRLPSGIYVYRLTATGEHGAHEATGRLTMLK